MANFLLVISIAATAALAAYAIGYALKHHSSTRSAIRDLLQTQLVEEVLNTPVGKVLATSSLATWLIALSATLINQA
ncbi:MAG: hypothetical protein HWE20_14310 [Gammaproteobacteria bacterium]|nr:hypothetical protein [Gammaproteobacteria bacterium]